MTGKMLRIVGKNDDVTEKHDCTEEFMPLGKCLKIDGKSPFLF